MQFTVAQVMTIMALPAAVLLTGCGAGADGNSMALRSNKNEDSFSMGVENVSGDNMAALSKRIPTPQVEVFVDPTPVVEPVPTKPEAEVVETRKASPQVQSKNIFARPRTPTPTRVASTETKKAPVEPLPVIQEEEIKEDVKEPVLQEIKPHEEAKPVEVEEEVKPQPKPDFLADIRKRSRAQPIQDPTDDATVENKAEQIEKAIEQARKEKPADVWSDIRKNRIPAIQDVTDDAAVEQVQENKALKQMAQWAKEKEEQKAEEEKKAQEEARKNPKNADLNTRIESRRQFTRQPSSADDDQDSNNDDDWLYTAPGQ
jgi:hypothetical protein